MNSQRSTKCAGVRRFGAAAAVVAAMAVVVAAAPGSGRPVPLLESADLSAWEMKEFSGRTRYTPVTFNGERVIKAVSDSSASGLYREKTIDLGHTPVLHWRWRVETVFEGVDETAKTGDDYPARVYVVATHPVFFWKTRALTYVWSSGQPRGSSWPNAFTENVRMIAVQSGSQGLGMWQQEARDVREDFKRYFNADVRYVDAIAIMSDTDNFGGRAVAYYGNIQFAAR